MVQVTRPGGHIALIGEYFGVANAFPIGPLMQKDLIVRGGPVYLHTYWKMLLGKIEEGALDLRPFFTHQMELKDVAEAYRMFDQREDDVLKIQLITPYGRSLGGSIGPAPAHTAATDASSKQ